MILTPTGLDSPLTAASSDKDAADQQATARTSRPAVRRPDIDGLRAIAIAAVVAFHIFPNAVPGGFVGVDVFFAISGYVISMSTYPRIDAGLFRLTDFYGRRVRRLFPALFIVFAACFLAGWNWLYASEFAALGEHIAAGVGFVSNLLLWRQSGYFDAPALTKPLLNLWSLGIEEQFYLIWPLILLFSSRWQGKRLAIIVILGGASLILDCLWAPLDSSGAFYAPHARFWELMIGAGLACASLYPDRRFMQVSAWVGSSMTQPSKATAPARVVAKKDGVSVLGVVLILWAVFGLNSGDIYPGLWALGPTVGTALVIGAGERALVNRYLLARKAFVYLGLISFPLYLWHWPLIVFFRMIEGPVSVFKSGLVLIAASVILASLTYHLVERPVARSRAPRRATFVLIGCMALIGAIGGATAWTDGGFARAGLNAHYSTQIAKWRFVVNTTCQSRFGRTLSDVCIANLAEPTIALIGDSHANQLYPGLIEGAGALRGVVSIGNAPALEHVAVSYERQQNAVWNDSPRSFDRVMAVIESDPHIKTIVVGGNWEPYVHGEFGPSYTRALNGHVTLKFVDRAQQPSDTPGSIFWVAFEATVDRLVASGKNIVIAIDTPEPLTDVYECARTMKAATPAACQFSRQDVLRDQSEFREIVKQVQAKYPKVKVFDPVPILCPTETCFVVRPPTLIYRDHNHISESSSDLVGKDLMKLIESFDMP